MYWTPIDAVSHTFGPDSPEHVREIVSFGKLLEGQFFGQLSREAAQDITFVLTADHGQVGIRGEDVLFLNPYLELAESYLLNKEGKAIYPTGAPHDVFLFIYEPKLDRTLEFLQRALQGKAVVLRTDDAISQGLFGLRVPSSKFLRRIGNILILPKPGSHVWYDYSDGQHAYTQKGMHGGLSREEMIVPFCIGNVGELLG